MELLTALKNDKNGSLFGSVYYPIIYRLLPELDERNFTTSNELTDNFLTTHPSFNKDYMYVFDKNELMFLAFDHVKAYFHDQKGKVILYIEYGSSLTDYIFINHILKDKKIQKPEIIDENGNVIDKTEHGLHTAANNEKKIQLILTYLREYLDENFIN
jgi:hypothetical protein